MTEEKQKNKLTKKQIFITAALIIFFGGIFLFSFLFANTNKKTELTSPKNENTNNSQPSSLIPAPKIATLSFQQKTATSAAILLDTGNKPVSAVQLEIAFDASSLHNIHIQPGKFFDNALSLISKVNYQNGSIFYVSAIPPTGDPKQGKGEIATLYYNFNNGAFNPTTLQFLPKTKVSVKGIDDSVLKTAPPLTIASQ